MFDFYFKFRMSILEEKRPLSEDETANLSNKRQKFDQPEESDLRSTSSNHVSLPLSQGVFKLLMYTVSHINYV